MRTDVMGQHEMESMLVVPILSTIKQVQLTRRKSKLMLREGSRPVATPKRKPTKPPSQEDVMWAGYMQEVRNNAVGDSFEPDSVNELMLGINDYRDVETHPVTTFSKDRDYPHGALPTPNKQLIWASITKK